MIEIPVLDITGKKVGTESLDPALFGERIRYDLLKQAVVTYRANKRQGTVATKSRGMVTGSTRKLYRQKGTGRARMGNARTVIRRGGGVAFAKVNRDFSKKLPRKMRRLARNSAILAKAQAGTICVLQGLAFDEPKTSRFAKILKVTNFEKKTLIAVTVEDKNLHKSARNIPDVGMKLVWELNAYDILRTRNLVFTPEAFKALVSDPLKAGQAVQAEA